MQGMNMRRAQVRRVLILGLSCVAVTLTTSLFRGEVGAQQLQSASFTLAQAAAGKAAYAEHCVTCHGGHLDDGAFAPPLSGEQFHVNWGGKPLDQLYAKLLTMPPGGKGNLGDDAYVNLLAYILQANRVSEGKTPLPSEPSTLATMMF